MRELIQTGAFLEDHDKYGYTALHWATEENLPVLIEAGANLEAKDRNQRTPLLSALVGSWSKEPMILLEAGADVRATDVFGYDALALAKLRGDRVLIRVIEERLGQR